MQLGHVIVAGAKCGELQDGGITPSGGSSPTPIINFGAVCDGVTDDTAAIQAAVGSLTTGGVLRYPDGKSCLINGTINNPVDGLYHVGGGISGNDSAGSTVICGSTSAANCYTWGSVTGGGLLNLRIDNTTRTGGSNIVSDVGGSHQRFEHLNLQANNAIGLLSTNTIIVNDVNVDGPASGGSGKYAVKWIGTLAGRSDALIIQNSVFNMHGGGADCIDWDGLANTMTISGVHCLNQNYGLHVTNVNGNASNFPAFLQAFDFEVDGGTGASVRIDAGGYYRFIHSDLFHSSNDVAVIINGDTAGSVVRSVKFVGGRIGNSLKQCVTSDAQGVEFDGVTFGSCSQQGSGLFPGVEFTAHALNSRIIGGAMADFGDGINATTGIQLDANVSFIQVEGIDLHYTSIPISNLSNAVNNYFQINGVNTLTVGYGKLPTGTQQAYFYRSQPGSGNVVRVENPNATASSMAGFEASTGTPSSFVDLQLIDGPTPQTSIVNGSGVTGGILLDASQAPAAPVYLKSSAGFPVQIVNSFLGSTLIGIGSLPTCVSAIAGWRTVVNNGIASPTYQQVVGTIGASVQPVYCNGANWLYD